MNKSAIKSFAIWARTKLINEITYKSGLIGITDKGISHPLDSSTDNIQHFNIGTEKPYEIKDREIKQRDAYIKRIKEKEATSDYNTAFNYIIEEIAYTWFNRLIAIRFMEVNDYLPSKTRVLSSETKGKIEPDMVTSPFDTDMEFTSEEKDYIISLKHDNKLDELFRFLFIKQCNTLNAVLPELFEKTSDYTELLLTISFTDSDGIVSHLVNDIPEEDFTEAVEIIGWLYQYYNTEPKDEVFALLKKNVKITKERIPAATQLFTPDWIVRYMVENSLGKLWVEGHPNNELQSNWKYYLEEAEQEDHVKQELEKIREEYKKLNPTDIKVIDPCMGSGHILVYAFDVLMQIYESQGYTQRDAANSIIEHNLYGLDIDDRAYQLAYFAVMMKARKYDRRFLTKEIKPKLYAIKESNEINKNHLKYFGNSLSDIEKNLATSQVEYLIDTYIDAKEYGSILNVDNCNWELLYRFIEDFNIEGQMSLDSVGAEDTKKSLQELIPIAHAMAQKYDVVITNPLYMGGSGMNTKVSNYVKKHYPDSKSDLFAVFIEKCMNMTKKNAFQSMITQHAWMFLSSYEKLRSNIIKNDFISMAHLGARAFEEIGGEVVQTTSFVLRTSDIKDYKANFVRLVDFNSQILKQEAFLAHQNIHTAIKENFSKIPGSPIAYWASNKILSLFNQVKLKDVATFKEGITTANNDLFLRYWFEVSELEFSISTKNKTFKWIPYNKGGTYRKWYGNRDYVINWENDGICIKEYTGSSFRNFRFQRKEGGTFSALTSGGLSARYSEEGFAFDSKGTMFFSDIKLKNILCYLNSKILNKLLKFVCPTLDYRFGTIEKLPFLDINYDINNCVRISKTDWDSFETSWDFRKHPLIDEALLISDMDDWEEMDNSSDLETSPEIEIFFDTGVDIVSSRIATSYEMYRDFTERQFNKLKSNEEELNRIFIDIYGLQDELTPDVEDKDVTIYRIFDSNEAIPESMKSSRYSLTKHDVIVSFVSYAVGCMFGRYSLDVEGLAYAGGDWDDSKYSLFIPDRDNCIPITDEEYLEDDIVGRFVEFVKVVYGADTLEENLDFIADALETKGNTSREMIRNYFVKDFYKDHVKTYQKRPIYWLYDSGKQNGFKALVYMHRYTADTTGIVRVDYLHKIQKIYTSEIDRMKDMAENSDNAREVAQAEKRKEKLIKQLKETKEYDEKIAHLALSRIAIDLDDGVKVNYEKVQTAQDGKKLEILGKI
ncbi:Predicted type II restriction enzyme, methylase subunit [Acetoanaerobium sticklandii]|uniref:site-specific DNA-methyltransferase (adenine-specific) n=1 Tax=Acetoanaerobium sticklandii (strain ATCC 12662 / DSM 519 / JCM 1433 / CCUG 9281 / NCIMB 10654 / HF) TaxID=499177 RepID=E3PXJ2_ACESD|nr:BREX-1 system adenine-specific DNA-methyltransferase PglX [Acetoanaerobium sticklandii]CBH21157.1 Predicted type II restriction enzyme, methylase subunit [Acetoanaerobium sticklandii]